MSVIATVSLPAEAFTLGAVLASTSDVRVRLERVVPVGDGFIPYLWASNETVGEIRAGLEAAADVATFAIVDNVNDEVLVRIDWAEEVDGFLDALARTGASILEGIGEAGGWRFQLRFAGHERLTAFYRQCADRGIDIDVERVHSPGTPEPVREGVDLTGPQREALELAFERGYFEVPRRVTIVELAEELDISDSAVSQRLRRGTATVLRSVLEGTDTRVGQPEHDA